MQTHLVEEVVPAAVVAPAPPVVVVVVAPGVSVPALFVAGLVRLLATLFTAAAATELVAARPARPAVVLVAGKPALVRDLPAVLLAAAAVEIFLHLLLGVAVVLALSFAAAEGDLLLHKRRLVLQGYPEVHQLLARLGRGRRPHGRGEGDRTGGDNGGCELHG